MAGGLYTPHPAAATRLRPPVEGLGLAVSGAACLKLRVRSTHHYHYHYHYYFHPHLLARRYSLRHLRHLHIGVPPCVGKMQVVSRCPWVLALRVFITQQGPSTTAISCCRWDPRWQTGLANQRYSKATKTAPAVVPPSRAGLGPVLGPVARTGLGPILGPLARDGQGPVLGPIARAG